MFNAIQVKMWSFHTIPFSVFYNKTLLHISLFPILQRHQEELYYGKLFTLGYIQVGCM